jgi:hypothetical protein
VLAVALLRLCATNGDLPPVSTKAHTRGRIDPEERGARLQAEHVGKLFCPSEL